MKLRKSKKTSPSAAEAKRELPEADKQVEKAPNPPRTTTGWMTSPKFGSAGSGGAEYEPGLDLN
ncbi:MAG TPA: hypothetical protein VIK25_13070 [Gemmatimonadaceae bacterium]